MEYDPLDFELSMDLSDKDVIKALAAQVRELFDRRQPVHAIKHLATCGLDREEALLILTAGVGLERIDAQIMIAEFFPQEGGQ